MTLVLLFAALLPLDAHADDAASAVATPGETISDPNTFDAWYTTQANNNATTGRIWADKTVDADPIKFDRGELAGQTIAMTPGADFQVALSALSSLSKTSVTDTVPLDIVLVLDASGSMSDHMGNGDRTKRIEALRAAVNSFLDAAVKQNDTIEDSSKQIQVAIVKFAGDKADSVGNDDYSLDGYRYNYSQIMQKLTLCTSENVNRKYSGLKATVGSISPAGATRSDYGLELAQSILLPGNEPVDAGVRANSKKIVIFFTDGTPTSFSNFDPTVASAAVTAAKNMKDKGVSIYTVGIFDGADPSASVDSNSTSIENKFMHAASSNYPYATYNSTWHKGYEFNFGTRAANSAFYKAATNADELKKVFDDIFQSLSTELTGPTEIEEGATPANGGYITFNDPLGDFMEVKGFNAVAFADKIYTTVEKKTDENEDGRVDTYTFTDPIESGVNPAYPENAKLENIIITVTCSNDSQTGDRVEVKIPANMLPLRYYDIQTVKGETTFSVSPTFPINVVYSVGLKDAVRTALTTGNISDDELLQYIANHTDENGKINFYSNYYDFEHPGTSLSNEHTIGNTTATFSPADSNNFYYHVTDTLLYTKTADNKYEPTTKVEPNKTYYYAINYYSLDENKNTRSNTQYVDISIGSQPEINKVITTHEDDGYCYIVAGTSKGSLPSKIDEQLGDKTITGDDDGNLTGTAKRRIDFKWDADYDTATLYLGNNGKLSFDAQGSLRITKVVSHDDGYTPDPSTEFTIKFVLTAKEGTSLDTNAEYKYTITDASGNKMGTDKIKSGETLKLKAGETAEIEGLPVGCTYKVTEKNLPKGYTSEIENGEGLIVAGLVKDTAPQVTVTNTYQPESVTLEGKTHLAATKTLKGRNWLASDTFTFHLETADPTAPMPDGVQTSNDSKIRYVERTLQDSAGFLDGAKMPFNFGDIRYTKPGTYIYTINEIIPSDGIPGISYDNTNYQVTVTVTDDQHGALEVTSTMQKTSDDSTAQVAAFTNVFAAKDETLVLKALKNYVYACDEGTSLTQKNGQFTFKLEASTVDEENKPLTDFSTPPMPDSETATSNDSGRVSFKIHYDDSRDTGKTYYYQLFEVNDKQDNVDYSNERYLIKVKLTVVDGNDTAMLKASPTYYKWDAAKNAWEELDKQPTESGMTFTNTFTGTTTAKLWVCKILAGRDWIDGDAFTFTLTPKYDNTPMPEGENADKLTITNASNHIDDNGRTGSFGEISFTKPGTYVYTISEDTVELPGFKSHPGDITATVTVTREDNQLIVSGTNYKDASGNAMGSHAYFTNTYSPDPAVLDGEKRLSVTKKLVGREWGKEESFTFAIAVAGGSDEGTPLPDSTTLTLTNPDYDTSDTATGHFGNIIYTKPGTYIYKITETKGGNAITHWDDSVYTATVTVVDNGSGELKINSFSLTKDTGDTNNGIYFENTYDPTPATVNLSAHKTLISDVGNHTLTEGEFTFNLLDKDGSIVQTVTNDAEGNVTFDELKFDTIGDYTYTICEVDGKLGYMTYDTSKYTVNFTVYDAQNGTLAATAPVYSLNGETVAKAEFTNRYTAELPEDASFSLNASKTLTGRSMIDGEFVFTLEDEGGSIVATATNDAEGNIVFPKVGLKDVQETYIALLAAEPAQPVADPTPVEDSEQPVQTEDGEQATPETAVSTYSLEDAPAVMTDPEPETDNEPTVDEGAVQKLLTRWYTIREYTQGKDGVTYDSNTYMVRVPLVDKDGTGTLVVDNDNIQFFAADGETPLDGNKVIFANSYAAQGVDLTVTAQKQLTGRSLADGEFSFRLSCNDDPANEQTVTSDANGRITFALHYDDKDGTGAQESHTYTVTEVRGDKDTITYDDTAYTFTVDVTDDGEGHLTTKVTQPETMIFRNVYTPKATSITLAGNKVLNGRAQKAGEFTFELCNANGAVIATAANGENGYFAFPALTYDEAGTYTYTVREKNTGASRVTYDTTVYSVTVQVRDEDGQLKADIILPASGLTFTNTYTPEPAPTPAPTTKPTNTPAPAATAAPTPAPVRIPQTADSFPLALLIGLLAVSGGVLAVLYTARKRGKK